ncbi:hypothetical protein BQ8482_300029 [Mesorhizobium delmotii]|uniref:Uncharacterized protein n=1 Tax=Mesorhizobium delmotii TaxID=1631247 RepID=A0A2P9ANK9_9HYPH|nr:hypothetical protein BQ8482_300029 [Mesorhizobium delmotii]
MDIISTVRAVERFFQSMSTKATRVSGRLLNITGGMNYEGCRSKCEPPKLSQGGRRARRGYCRCRHATLASHLGCRGQGAEGAFLY